MILTDKEIRNYVQSDVPLIENFKEDSLQSESYDLSLGKVVSRLDSKFKILHLDQQETIDGLYLQEIVPDNGYLLGPGEYILISVEEKINMPQQLTAHIRPRTKFTRVGLLVSGQHCNSSYSGYLSLGLYNATPFSICIKSGMKVAQIVFEELYDIPSIQKQYRKKSSAVFQNEIAIRGADFSNESIMKLQDFDGKPDAKKAYQSLIDGLKRRDK